MAPSGPLDARQDLRLLKTTARRGMNLAAWGAAAFGALLAAPLGAHAFDAYWFFIDGDQTTKGSIKGLVDGYNAGGGDEVVEVTDSPLESTKGGNWIFDSTTSPFAFNVRNGELVAADALYTREIGGEEQSLRFWMLGPGNDNLGLTLKAQISNGSNSSTGSETFFIYIAINPPPETAPAPLPIFGAAAAFGASRQLRKRIRATKSPFVTAPPE